MHKTVKRLFPLAPMAVALSLSGTCIAQGADDQGAGSFDGNFLKPDSSAFIPLTDWTYTFDQPSSSWISPTSQIGSAWQSTLHAVSFNYGGLATGDSADNVEWPASKDGLWIRANFTVSSDEIDDLMFWGRWDDNVTIYINGVEAVDRRGWTSSYRYLGISDAARASINANGTNLIAVHVQDTGGGKHLNLSLARAPRMAQLPMESYSRNNHFQQIVDYVQDQMSMYGVSAGSISIGKVTGGDADIVLSAGIGYMDKAFSRPVPEDAIFRLGSLDKPPVDLAARRLVESGTLNPATGAPLQLTTEVFPMLAALGLQPLSTGIADERVNDITIEHLITHNSGLPGLPFDAAYYNSVGATDGHVTIEDNMRWLYSQSLVAAPGSNPGYSNSSYDVLRYMIDQVAPGGLEAFMQQELFATPEHKFYIAGGPVDERVYTADNELLEPWYTTFIEDDDGIIIGSHGVLAASAESYTRYLLRNPSAGLYYGAFDGTLTVMQKFSNAEGEIFGFTAMFNMRDGIPFRVWENDVVIEENFDGTLQAMIEALPLDAWAGTTPGTSCHDTIQGWGMNAVPNCSLDIPHATNWSVGAYQGGSGWASYHNEELKVNINQPGSEHWHVQAVTPVNLAAEGNYVVSFRARAESPRSIVVNLGHNGSSDNNWTSYAQKQVQLTTQMRTYTVSLSDIPIDSNARLDFNVGGDVVADVIIDEVYLAPVQ